MNRIKEFRVKKNLSQSDIANIMNIKQNTFSQWENDIRTPSVIQALQIAEVLEMTVEELYKKKN